MSAKKKQIVESDPDEDEEEQKDDKPADINNTVLYDLMNLKKEAT